MRILLLFLLIFALPMCSISFTGCQKAEVESTKSVDSSRYAEKYEEKNAEVWLEKTDDKRLEDYGTTDFYITSIYADCFFARPIIPMPYEVKFNGAISDEWCVGDKVACTYKNTYYDEETFHMEADLLTIDQTDFELDPNMCYKPVIYLYPEKETKVCVKLDLDGHLTCTYPSYGDEGGAGWTVTALPDGTLIGADGQTYNYLYWEGETLAEFDFSEGFCVSGADTAAFLDDVLAKIGLNRREANEFIVYWLPLMEKNPYNVISFQSDAYTDAAKLLVDPSPDTLLRVFMAWYPVDTPVSLTAQTFTAPSRTGFTVIEWGGTKVGQ